MPRLNSALYQQDEPQPRRAPVQLKQSFPFTCKRCSSHFTVPITASTFQCPGSLPSGQKCAKIYKIKNPQAQPALPPVATMPQQQPALPPTNSMPSMPQQQPALPPTNSMPSMQPTQQSIPYKQPERKNIPTNGDDILSPFDHMLRLEAKVSKYCDICVTRFDREKKARAAAKALGVEKDKLPKVHSPKEFEWICFDHFNRLCNEHETGLHIQSTKKDHIRIPRTLFQNIKLMFFYLVRVYSVGDDEKVLEQISSHDFKSKPKKQQDALMKVAVDRMRDAYELSEGKQTSKGKYVFFPYTGKRVQVNSIEVNAPALFEVASKLRDVDSDNYIPVSTLQDVMKKAEGKFESVDFRQLIQLYNDGARALTSGEGASIVEDPGKLMILKEKALHKNLDGTCVKSIQSCCFRFDHWLQSSHFWRDEIATVQSKFGANVATYFIFLRFLFYLNVIMTFFLTVFLYFIQWFDPVEAEGEDDYWGWFFGHGMEQTFLFYGGYKPTYDWTSGSYQMRTIMIYTTGGLMIMSLFYTLSDISNKQSLAKKDKSFKWSSILFGQYDYTVHEEKQLQLMNSDIRTKMMAQLDVDQLKSEEKNIEKVPWNKVLISPAYRAMYTVFILMAINITIVQLLIEQEQVMILDMLVDYTPEYNVTYWAYLITPGAFALCRMFFSKAIKAIMRIEYENERDGPKWRSYFGRVLLLRLSYIGVIMNGAIQGQEDTDSETCLESVIGMTFYRVLLCDFIVEIVFSLIFPCTRVQFNKCCLLCKGSEDDSSIEMDDLGEKTRKDLKKAKDAVSVKFKFDLLDNTLDILYRQTLIWSGLSFCPFLPVEGVIFMVILFQVKIWQVMYYTRRSRNPIEVGRQYRFFKTGMIFCVLTSLAPFSYFMNSRVECGPHDFRAFNEYRLGAMNFTNSSSSLYYTNASTVAEIFYYDIQDRYPDSVTVVFDYMGNALALWMAVIMSSIYVFATFKRKSALDSEIKKTTTRLKRWTAQRKDILAQFPKDKVHSGKQRFKEYLSALGPLGVTYGKALAKVSGESLTELTKLDDVQIMEVFRKMGAGDHDSRIMQSHLVHMRHKLIAEYVRLRSGNN